MKASEFELGAKIGGAILATDKAVGLIEGKVLPAVGLNDEARAALASMLRTPEGKALLMLAIGQASSYFEDEQAAKAHPKAAKMAQGLGPAFRIAAVATGSASVAGRVLTGLLDLIEKEGEELMKSFEGGGFTGVRMDPGASTAKSAAEEERATAAVPLKGSREAT